MTEDPPSAAPARHGQEVIQDYLKTLDSSPGVYRMLNARGEVLYVGKARNLKARVSSYARGYGHSPRIARMIAETASMMFLTVRTETEALLLEQNLIKQLKPRYNVLLRDDKSFPNILIAKHHAFPQIKKHRGAQGREGQLLRPLRQRGGGEPHAEPVAEGVSAAELLGQHVRRPHPALPAIPDQALLGALRRQDHGAGLRRAGRRMPRCSCRASPPQCRPSWRGRWTRRPRRWSSSAPRRCATGSGR